MGMGRRWWGGRRTLGCLRAVLLDGLETGIDYKFRWLYC